MWKRFNKNYDVCEDGQVRVLSGRNRGFITHGGNKGNGYKRIQNRERGRGHHLIQRMVLGAFCPQRYEEFDYVDHINGIRNDNRLCNLRWSNNTLNQYNRIGTKGWEKHGRFYRTVITHEGRTLYVGNFYTIAAARKRYIAKKAEFYHEYLVNLYEKHGVPWLNIPPQSRPKFDNLVPFHCIKVNGLDNCFD